MKWLALLLAACTSQSAATPPAGFPFGDESLAYNIVWPSGLSLGEGRLSATRSGAGWAFDLSIDASVPGYTVKDSYHATTGSDLCATEFDRQTVHGAKKLNEKTTFSGGAALRKTLGGGESSIPVGTCPHDALSFLFKARSDLGQGKVPQPEKIVLGNVYPLQLQYTGLQNVVVANVPTPADRVFCTVTVRETQKYEFEVFFARDAARTPLLIRVPFALGAISMELVR